MPKRVYFIRSFRSAETGSFVFFASLLWLPFELEPKNLRRIKDNGNAIHHAVTNKILRPATAAVSSASAENRFDFMSREQKKSFTASTYLVWMFSFRSVRSAGLWTHVLYYVVKSSARARGQLKIDDNHIQARRRRKPTSV